MPVAARQAVSSPIAVFMLNGNVRRKPGSWISKLNAGEGIIRVSARASKVMEVKRPIRFESGIYLSCSTIIALYLSHGRMPRHVRYGRIKWLWKCKNLRHFRRHQALLLRFRLVLMLYPTVLS